VARRGGGDDVESPTDSPTDHPAAALEREIARGSAQTAYSQLADEPDAVVAEVLGRMIPPHALRILEKFRERRREAILAQVPESRRHQWEINASHPDQSVGRLMVLPVGIFPPETTIRSAIEGLREAVKTAFISYIHVTDAQDRLIGVVVMREMLLANPARPSRTSDPCRRPASDMQVADAMREAVQRHFPVYPVCDESDRLVGLVRGEDLFQQRVFQLVVQAGSMVGVEKEERLATPWPRALRLRNPWLLVNLLTAFAAGAVVGAFEETIGKLVTLAAFLPILAGQSGNTGCQALAVTLRGMTLGELAETARSRWSPRRPPSASSTAWWSARWPERPCTPSPATRATRSGSPASYSSRWWGAASRAASRAPWCRSGSSASAPIRPPPPASFSPPPPTS
jgi:magnesium transporter